MGVCTACAVITVCVVDLGPLHPVAVTVIVEVPNQVGANVTSPLVEFMIFPPDKLVLSRA